MIALNEAQKAALKEIRAAQSSGKPTHLLTGYAGSGKTTLMHAVARAFQERGNEVVVSAPTHKATAVLRSKVDPSITCRTIHSLLSLQPSPNGAQTVLVRSKRPQPISCDVVIIDECSMISIELMRWIRELIPHCFVLFVGDPAQLPPVNEIASPSFSITSRSHLDTIVRQAAGNPILEAAGLIRRSQNKFADWSWIIEAKRGSAGVFIPKDPLNWMKKAFLSPEFEQNNDTFRFLCWRNKTVQEVNQMVRQWRYGEDADLSPFRPGESVITRAPIFQASESDHGVMEPRIVFTTNEEISVVNIEQSRLRYDFPATDEIEAWATDLPTWKITLRGKTPENNETEVTAHMVSDDAALRATDGRLLRETKADGARWKHRFGFNNALLNLTAIYAMTVHTSQGSTFKNAFVDIGDIRCRERDCLLESQQLSYVALTRATDMVFLVNAGAAARSTPKAPVLA